MVIYAGCNKSGYFADKWSLEWMCKMEVKICRRQLTKSVYLLCNISKEYNLETATKETKVFGFVGTDHLRTNII